MRRLELAAYLGIASSTLYEWMRAGRIPKPLPGTERWDRVAVDAALDRMAGIKNGAPDDRHARKARFLKNRQSAA
jgi:excisionase family DNA binding protein